MNFSTVLMNMQLAYETFVMWLALNWRSVLSGMLVVLLSVTGFFGYRAYKTSCEMKAHKAYLKVERVALRAVAQEKSKHREEASFDSEEQKNVAVLEAGTAFLAEHRGSGFDASVHGFMAQAFVGQGKLDDARAHMTQAQKTCSSDELRQMYALSVALMKLDSDDEGLKAEGLSSLKGIAQDSSSAACDAALFRLGEKYWNEKNYQEARLWWGQLLAVADRKQTPMGGDIRSPWVAAAREKLALIDYR